MSEASSGVISGDPKPNKKKKGVTRERYTVSYTKGGYLLLKKWLTAVTLVAFGDPRSAVTEFR